MAQEGKVPVRESVGAALRFVREHLSLTLVISAVAALVLTVLSAVSLQAQANPMLGLPISIATTFVSAAYYAAFVSTAVKGGAGLGQRLLSETGRLWVAMALITLFFVIVFVVLLIPTSIILAMTLGPYLSDLQSAGQDEAAMMAVFSRYAMENPGPLLLTSLFFLTVWLLLSSRLFLSAPATIDAGRILTFETWKWTKGNLWRITAARLMLLGPAYILVFALTTLAGRGLGINTLDPYGMVAFAQSNLPLYAVFVFASQFVSILAFHSLEAGLSSYLYRGLKPDNAAANAFA